MTDNEIIKALECCKIDRYCYDCPLLDNTPSGKDCIDVLFEQTLSLINRQKAEIEGLNYIRAELSRDIDHFRESAKMVKSEAIKEFAGRLKVQCFLPLGTYIAVRICTEKEIDNLVKEMTEENNA